MRLLIAPSASFHRSPRRSLPMRQFALSLSVASSSLSFPPSTRSTCGCCSGCPLEVRIIRNSISSFSSFAGMCWIAACFVLYVIRRSKQAWSYNWTEQIADTKQVRTSSHFSFFISPVQMLALAFLRCLSIEAAVHLVLLNIRVTPGGELLIIRDFLLR